MDLSDEYILKQTDFSNLTLLDILKHVDRAHFVDKKDFKKLYPLSLELNSGVFTRDNDIPEFSVAGKILQ